VSSRRAVLSLTVMTLVLAGMALASCGGGGSEQEEAKARPLPETPQELRPGEYRSKEFKPSLSFRVGKGWANNAQELPDFIELERQEVAGAIRFANIKEVYKPGTRNVVEAPKDLIGWFQHHPYLKTDEPEPVMVGGVEGEQIDVLVEDLPEDYYGGVCGRGCVDIAPLSGGEQGVFFKEANKRRVIVLEDVKGERVYLDFSSPIDAFDEFAPEAQKVVDSVKWGGS
jgi:hypothetical protein